VIEKITKIVGCHANPYLIVFIFLVLAVLDVIGISLVPILLESAVIENTERESQNWLITYLPIFDDYEATWVFPLIVMLLFFIKSIVYVLSNYLIYRFSYSVMHQNRVELISLLLNSRYQTIINKSAADFINLLQLHINQSVSNYLVPALKLISDILVAVLILTYLLFSFTKLTLFLFSVIFLFSFSYWIISNKYLYDYGKQSYKHNHSMIDLAKSIRTGFVDITVNGGVSYFKSLFTVSSLRFSEVQIQSATIRVIPRPMFEWLIILFVIFLVLSNSGMESNATAIAIFATFGMAAIRLLPATTSIIASLSLMKNTEAVVEKYFSEKDILVDEQNKTNVIFQKPPNNINGKNEKINVEKIVAENLYFYHDKGNKLLNSISFTIQKGDTIGIVGPSGSGKSTIISLIIGLISPVEGSVCLNSTNVLEVVPSDYFAYVPQFPFISNDTLLNNIVYPGGPKDIPHIINLMKSLGLSDLVNGKVAKLSTIVGENGIRLSGGQAQRIALVRAIIQDKDILIIDEATSALDNASSSRVMNVLNEIKKNKIVIVISHRKEISEICDRVYKLENGFFNEIQY
jgi:ATP-binding cassette, subfamily B, bacterial PglK